MPAQVTEREAQLEILKQAILQASQPRVKALLLTLVQSSKEAREISLGALTTTMADNRNQAVTAEPDVVTKDLTEEVPGAPAQGKRKRTDDDETDAPPKSLRKRYEWCEQCEKEYDITKNTSGICTWHPGHREPDFEGLFWADHDENCHGRIEDLEDEFPEGFTWSCCGKNGEITHCQIGKHQPDESKAYHGHN